MRLWTTVAVGGRRGGITGRGGGEILGTCGKSDRATQSIR